MLRSHAPSPTVHWSKDFVEHLRTVHFTLLAVCVGLILILSRTNSPALSQIRQIVQLKKQWPPKELAQEYVDMRSKKAVTLPLGESDKYIVLRVKEGQPYDFRVSLPIPNWLVLPDPSRVAQFPATLAGFRDWWGHLVKSPAVCYFPVRILPTAGGLVLHGPTTLEVLSASDPSLGGTKPYVELKSDFQWRDDASGKQLDHIEYFVFKNDIHDSDHFFVDVAGARVGRLDQDAIIRIGKSLGWGWQPGPFERSFSALSQEASGLEAEDLEEVEKVLTERLANRSEEFEAFGMKFPISQVTVWGSVILLGIQLYFFLYLKQLSGKLSPDDPGWDVPWIGLNKSRLAQTIFFATVVILPSVAMFLITSRASSRLTAGYWAPDSWHLQVRFKDWGSSVYVQIAAYLVASIAGVYLGTLCWRLRPQLAETSDET